MLLTFLRAALLWLGAVCCQNRKLFVYFVPGFLSEKPVYFLLDLIPLGIGHPAFQIILLAGDVAACIPVWAGLRSFAH